MFTDANVIGVMHNEYVARTLVILVKVPLITQPMRGQLTIWQINYVELKAPDNQNYYAKMTDVPKCIIHGTDNPYYLTARDLNDLILTPS